MDFITIEQTAALLNVVVTSVRSAIVRGALTRAGHQGRNVLLIKQQVLLFSGNNPRTGHQKRMSLEALNANELEQWHMLEKASKIADTPRLIDVDAIIETKVSEHVNEKLRTFIDLQVTESINKELMPFRPFFEALKPLFEQGNNISANFLIPAVS